MKVLITSKAHKHYDKTGFVISDKRGEGLEVRLDRTEEIVRVPEGQFKFIRYSGVAEGK